jgi:hypothetical protein
MGRHTSYKLVCHKTFCDNRLGRHVNHRRVIDFLNHDGLVIAICIDEMVKSRD